MSSRELERALAPYLTVTNVIVRPIASLTVSYFQTIESLRNSHALVYLGAVLCVWYADHHFPKTYLFAD